MEKQLPNSLNRSHFLLPDILVQRFRTPATSKMELLGTIVNDLH